MAGHIKLGRSSNWCRPEIQQRLHARCGCRSRREPGNERDRCLVQVLAESFIVAEQKRLVLANRATGRRSELVSLKRWRRSLIEIVGRVERIVADKLVQRSVPGIAARLRHDDYLPAPVFSVFLPPPI